MNDLELKYNRWSIKGQRRSDRIQLLLASFSFFMGYVDSIKDYHGLLLLIPVSTFILSVVNIIIVIRYAWFEQKYGYKLETTIFRINGIMMLITALSFEFIGEHNVQYVYYLISIIYFVILPNVVIKKRTKMKMRFLPEKIVVMRSFLKPIEYLWNDIEVISQKKELLKIERKNKRKIKKHYLIFDKDTEKSELSELLQTKQNEFGFSLEYL
jgi:hypothetical protein